METEESLAERYEAARLKGEKRIQERWHYLASSTRELLRSTGYYSEHGRRLDVEEDYGMRSPEQIDRLEHLLGTLGLCVSARLPFRHEVGALIPAEALNTAVITSCAELVLFGEWCDPEFLRLGLTAIAVHEEAGLLPVIGPARSQNPALGCMGVVAKIGLMLSAPAALAWALAAAVDRNAAGSALALYIAGAGVIAAVSLKRKGKGDDCTRDEKAHAAWQAFRMDGMGVLGAGASSALQRMAIDGVKVPAVAIDICEALQHQTLRACAALKAGSRD